MITLAGITLPNDLEWVDEFSWSPVSQSIAPTLAGTIVIEESALFGARPVTLFGGPISSWVQRSLVESLYALRATPDQSHSLDYHGTVIPVRFKQGEESIETRQIMRVANPGATHKYSLTLKLEAI